MRVASVVPALTETLYALGVQPVAVSAACDYPPAVNSTPTVVEPRIDASADQATIDEQVTERMEDTGSLYRVDEAVLHRTDPDLILTQGTCEVCAVSDDQIRETASRADIDSTVHSFHPHTLSDTLELIERLGSILDVHDAAERLLTSLRHRISAVEHRASATTERPRVLVLDWTDPPMVAGHWTPELVDIAGGTPVLASPGQPAGGIAWETILQVDPEVLIVAPCGFDCGRGLDSVEGLSERSGWEDLSAVRQDEVYVMDGTQLINRPGPRLVDSLEVIESLLDGSPELDAELVVTPA